LTKKFKMPSPCTLFQLLVTKINEDWSRFLLLPSAETTKMTSSKNWVFSLRRR
jgi:hypothetical protein